MFNNPLFHKLQNRLFISDSRDMAHAVQTSYKNNWSKELWVEKLKSEGVSFYNKKT